jgi:ProP effector
MNDTTPTTTPTPASTAEASETTAPIEATSAHQRQARRGGRGRTQAKPQQQARAPRAVHPVLKQLFDLYPKMFGAQFLPLKLGVFQDLLAQHPDLFKRDELKVALGLHARSMRYLESVAAGHQRHDLNGEPVEPVAPEHVHHAIMEVFRRRQMRTDQDLRPFAKAQLIVAIEASGLSREDFLLCVRQQDEVSVALLDEAFAELGEQAAKREALRKTFEASGKTVAEFSDMYGMDPTEVTETLERARIAQTILAAQAASAAADAQEPPAEVAPAESHVAP